MDYQNQYQQNGFSNYQQSGYQATEAEMGWDDEVAASEEPQHITLPQGDYPFEVIKFERDHFSGSAKMSPCKKAVYTLRITAPDGRQTTLRHQLFVHKLTDPGHYRLFRVLGHGQMGGIFPAQLEWRSRRQGRLQAGGAGVQWQPLQRGQAVLFPGKSPSAYPEPTCGLPTSANLSAAPSALPTAPGGR